MPLVKATGTVPVGNKKHIAKETIMGFFGPNITEVTESSVGGDGTRVTTTYDDGSAEDKTYVNGTLVDITDHDCDGSSHSHTVGHGIFGPFKGSQK
jgi:hypothetical protein